MLGEEENIKRKNKLINIKEEKMSISSGAMIQTLTGERKEVSLDRYLNFLEAKQGMQIVEITALKKEIKKLKTLSYDMKKTFLSGLVGLVLLDIVVIAVVFFVK